jgi:CheY-like chemotaxis protein
MTAQPTGPLVAVVNTSEEVARLIQTVLEDEGFRAVVAYVVAFRTGREDLGAFLRRHDPAVVVWDLAIPYAENWQYLQTLITAGTFAGRGLVLTTTNKRALDELVGGTPAQELVGKPFDLDALVQAVRRALPTGSAAPRKPPRPSS